MPKETMTSRERWLAVLTRQKPDRVPMDYWATSEATEKLCRYLGCDFDGALRRLHIDIPLPVWGQYVGPKPAEGLDVWGLRHKGISYGTGTYYEVVNAPLGAFTSVAEIEQNYRWPTADDWDVSHIPDRVKGKDDRPVRGGYCEPFLLYCQLRGLEQAYQDLVENPEIVEYCLGKLFDLAYESTRRIFETIPGRVTFCYVAEDLGSQQGLLMSREHIRRFLFPGMKRMIELAHSAGVYVFHHDDGAIRDIIPDLIELGIDILNPIQWRLPGMDREGLKRDFGSKLIFHGAVDNQTTLPFGTVADVRREVAENLQILGAGGGYILGPCHNIQAVSPPENVVAMYEAGYELGWVQ
jgi:Uroporphyrinogen-III decarboxylase